MAGCQGRDRAPIPAWSSSGPYRGASKRNHSMSREAYWWVGHCSPVIPHQGVSSMFHTNVRGTPGQNGPDSGGRQGYRPDQPRPSTPPRLGLCWIMEFHEEEGGLGAGGKRVLAASPLLGRTRPPPPSHTEGNTLGLQKRPTPRRWPLLRPPGCSQSQPSSCGKACGGSPTGARCKDGEGTGMRNEQSPAGKCLHSDKGAYIRPFLSIHVKQIKSATPPKVSQIDEGAESGPPLGSLANQIRKGSWILCKRVLGVE